MELILKKETCRNFLNNYHKDIYPILLPKIIEIGILTLKLSFNKDLFSPDELNDITTSLNQQYKYQKQKNNKQIFNPKKIKPLSNNYLNTLSVNNSSDSLEEKYLNTYDSSNFYDSNYFIPESKAYRNKQLYNKRLENPMFNTLNKNVYPFWWWNQKEPDYLIDRQNTYGNSQKVSNDFIGINNKKLDNKKNIFSLNNKNNYKISYDKDLNVIKIEKGKKRKIKK